ncbi:hypothetical protein P8605_17985 [Streptomyces sp. T-3]|nr:hypothetical protein [Streptomyces sp. T-3]
MTTSFEWAGFASVVVTGLSPVLAALLPGCLERLRARRRRATRTPSRGQRGHVLRSGPDVRGEQVVRVSVSGTGGVAVAVHAVGADLAVHVVCACPKEQGPW